MSTTSRIAGCAVIGLCLLWTALARAAESDPGAFLRVDIPKHEVYLGELVPLRVQAFFPPDTQVTINGAPVIKGDAFTTGQISDKPRQTEETVGGQPYVALTWNTALSAVKTGDFPLLVQLPCTLTYRERGRMPDLRQLFGSDPFSEDPSEGLAAPLMGRSMLEQFMGKVREKQLLLSNRLATLRVEPLPSAGRPPGFDGAIGEFAVSASAAPLAVTAGDPLTLKLEVRGAGNFDRLVTPMLANSAVWKTYAPSARFTAANTSGSQGVKTFEQAVVAQQAGPQEIPALRISFFDPRARRYVTRTTAPIAVSVAVAPAQRTIAVAPGAAAMPAANPELLPNQVEAGRAVRSLRPLFQRPWFLAAQALPVLALAGGLLLRRRRLLLSDPSRGRSRAAGKAVQAQLAVMDRAATAQDTGTFFRAARGALQQRLGQRWGMTPEAITLSEIDARLGEKGAGLRPIFAFADHINYSGQELAAADLMRWRQVVREQLKHVEASS